VEAGESALPTLSPPRAVPLPSGSISALPLILPITQIPPSNPYDCERAKNKNRGGVMAEEVESTIVIENTFIYQRMMVTTQLKCISEHFMRIQGQW
jgi:hypothetical protein